jgi:glyceraldehyde-3-phosphate dehydrogenase (NADP+)
MGSELRQASSHLDTILRTSNFINGVWQEKGTGGMLSVLDKYSHDVIANLPLASADQMEVAITSSVLAFEQLKKWSAGRRSEHLQQVHDLLNEHREAFVELLIREAGKPASYAQNEITRCLTTIGLAAAEAIRFDGEVIAMDYGAGEGKTAFTKRVPIGPIACITPFNFPGNLVLHKVAPALAVGCPVVVKPAPQAPLTALALAGLFQQAGYPAGAVNVVVCDIPVAEKLVRDERMRMLSFTGSDKVGWHLKAIAGKKKVILELGGNAAVIVDETADLTTAAKAVSRGAYAYAGQTCISTQRIFVHEKVYDRFSALLVEEIKSLKTGDPSEADVAVGPIIDGGHAERIKSWVEEAVEGGAKVLVGGDVLDERRNLFEPTLLTDVSDDMKVSCDEVFGPVATIEKVRDFDAAIEQTNKSRFGLQAGVFTNDLSHVRKAHRELEVGGIMINNVPGFRVDSMPYGGVKDSGLGREGIRYAMEEMTEARLLVY